MIEIEPLLREFIDLIASGSVEVYNEFSLQHELGIFLRTKLPDYKVQFERNVSFFGIKGTVKHEIDIVIYNNTEKYAIELKQPRNGQHPEQMFCFIKDIKFMEQLKKNGFNGTYCLTLVQDKKFYSGTKKDGIYRFFRGTTPVHGEITKPTGEKNDAIKIDGSYNIEWLPVGNGDMFYIVSI